MADHINREDFETGWRRMGGGDDGFMVSPLQRQANGDDAEAEATDPEDVRMWEIMWRMLNPSHPITSPLPDDAFIDVYDMLWLYVAAKVEHHLVSILL
jgi:hypothetical protein